MSILIKGVEMPQSCGECFACKAELSQEKKVIYVCCFTREEYVSDENRVETDCPLVPVPPHGRLIDADVALRSEQPPNVTDEQWSQTTLARCIINAPTIIEADET